MHVHQPVYSQLVWSPVGNCFADYAEHLPENFREHVKLLFYVNTFMFGSGWVGIKIVGIWLWITMPPRHKLSILDRGRDLAWPNDDE